MDEKFHERFNIQIGIEEARRRFVNRIHNAVFEDFLLFHLSEDSRFPLSREIANALGDRFEGNYPANFVGNDFLRNLAAIEGFYEALTPPFKLQLSRMIAEIINASEVDIGVIWDAGKFRKTGARLLDDRTVNDVLKWLRQDGYETVYDPFEKGLDHLLHSTNKPELLKDVITDVYEALEALAKIRTGRDADLSANREAFIKQVGASDNYKRLLKEYVVYAQNFRHAVAPSEEKVEPSPKEVESFVYLTGLFIRLAMPSR